MPVLETYRRPAVDFPQEAGRIRSHGMDGTRKFLELILNAGLAEGRLRGVFHIAIGRRVSSTEGTVLATGITWRELAGLLKELKFQTDWVRAFGVEPDTIAPRDREKFWYHAVSLARVDSAESRAEAELLATQLRPLGLIVGPPPTPNPSRSAPSTAKPNPTKTPEDDESAAGKKKPKPKKK